MELSQQSIHDVIHPTAAFTPLPSDTEDAFKGSTEEIPWHLSALNPKNRIDSLDPLDHGLWRIDGCTAFGSQFYAVPLFLPGPLPPLRVDLFIPESTTVSTYLRQTLDMDVIFHTRDEERIACLGITRHLLRILQHWTGSLEKPEDLYKGLPFGSRFVLENIPIDVADARIIVAPMHSLERRLPSLSYLKANWGPGIELPPTIDLNETVYVSQLHDSVCLIKIKGEAWIFKALTSHTKYLFHELHELLTIESHPNIIARPGHLVTKRCSFGNKLAVLGFTSRYHEPGSIRDLVPFLRVHGQTTLANETLWSLQLCSALLHLQDTTKTYYSDLRLDNIVLSNAGDVVMVDFEQRGVWCEFSAPEANAIEYVRLLAVDEDIPLRESQRYADMLSEMLPGWENIWAGEEYRVPGECTDVKSLTHGYNVPWTCLTATEREACEVYMLGRVLWCIFEAHSAPQRAAVWLSYRWEPIVEFPAYLRTPKPMQHLIDRCTRGRRPGMSKFIVREGSQLVLRDLEGTSESTAYKVQETAKQWWSEEIRESVAWLEARNHRLRDGTWNENYYGRPSLREVRDELFRYRQDLGFEAV